MRWSAIARTHADRRQGRREGGRLLGREAPEEVLDDVPGGSREGQRQDRAGEARERPADDDREDDDRWVQLDGVALDVRDEERVLDLLDDEVERERREDRGRAVGGGEEHGGDGRD